MNTRNCPLCKHKNFHRAPFCIKCNGYDFINQRKITKKKEPPPPPAPTGKKKKGKPAEEEIEIDDVPLVEINVTPKETTKVCPVCGHACFWRAPRCTNCNKYDFLNKEEIKVSKRKEEEEEFSEAMAAHHDARRVHVGDLKEGARFVSVALGIRGIVLTADQCAAKVKLFRGGKVETTYWSPITPVCLVRRSS